jgi:hypothetical protein
VSDLARWQKSGFFLVLTQVVGNDLFAFGLSGEMITDEQVKIGCF